MDFMQIGIIAVSFLAGGVVSYFFASRLVTDAKLAEAKVAADFAALRADVMANFMPKPVAPKPPVPEVVHAAALQAHALSLASHAASMDRHTTALSNAVAAVKDPSAKA